MFQGVYIYSHSYYAVLIPFTFSLMLLLLLFHVLREAAHTRDGRQREEERRRVQRGEQMTVCWLLTCCDRVMYNIV